MISSNMSLQGVVFAECLIAWWIRRASKPIVSFMSSYMSPESRCCQEALCTSLPVAFIGSLMGV